MIKYNIFNDNIINISENIQEENIKINQNILNNKIDKINNYFITINPCINLINNFNILLQLIKLIIINLIAFIIFIFLGKLLYLKNLLKNIEYINKKKNNKKIIKNKYKKNKIIKIIKNPTFFIQCIFQYIFIIVILLLIINLFFPIIMDTFENEDYINELE